MEELLKRWANLEPAWCELRVGGSYLVGNITVDGDSVAYRAHPPFTEPHSLMRVQFTVQQAIVAQGWYFELRYLTPERKYKAEVANRHGEWSDNPAAALLSAYLKALAEVTKKG